LVDSSPALPESMNKLKKYFTSAKNGQNVSKLFNDLTVSVLAKIQRGDIRTDGTYGVKKGNISKGTKLKANT
jgi:hypothetical protein